MLLLQRPAGSGVVVAGRSVVLSCGEAQPVGAGVELAGSSVVLRCRRVAIAGQISTL